MERYIRLDVKGTWKGNEHQSRFAAWYYDEDDKYLENGVSCYKLDVDGLKDLWVYATDHMSIRNEKEAERFQITVFKGEHSGKVLTVKNLHGVKKQLLKLIFFQFSKNFAS